MLWESLFSQGSNITLGDHLFHGFKDTFINPASPPAPRPPGPLGLQGCAWERAAQGGACPAAPAVIVLLPGSPPSAYAEAHEASLPLLQGSLGRCLCDGRGPLASPGTGA